MFSHDGVKLRMNVAPLAHAADVDEVLAQELFLLSVRQFVNALATFGICNPLPQLQIPAELALLVVKLHMRLIGLGLHLHRAITHVLHTQRRRNHQHLVQRATLACLDDHAAHARVQRQLRQLLAHASQLVGIVHRAEFIEQLVAIGNRAAGGALQEREVFNDAQVQRLHAQDHTCKR